MTTKPDESACCPLLAGRWNPYAVGAGIGVLSMLVFWLADKPLGMSTALSQASGACAAGFMGWENVAANAYWAKHVPKWDYGMLFLAGTLLGALVAAVVGKRFRIETVPTVWRERFGPSVAKRMIGAVIGGALAMFGARLAGGCTSGHGISGSLQLAVGSWTFFIVMFAAGVATAFVLFRKTK
jgi:uncharacterized membrane protein YedE/YeeE